MTMNVGAEERCLLQTKAALLIVDVQEKGYSFMEHSREVMHKMLQAVKGFQILRMPIYVTEQGNNDDTAIPLKRLLGPTQVYFTKTTFSVLGDDSLRHVLLDSGIAQWVIIGAEAHVSILQTARDFVIANKQAVVLNDAISSRSIYDFSTAIAEMREMRVRVSSTETVLFELLKGSDSSEYGLIKQLVTE